METIRPYCEKDRPDVERICIETAGPFFRKNLRRQEGTLAAFCRVYITHSPETCFVATDGEDRPVGYIFCAPVYGSWCKAAARRFAEGFPYGLIWNLGSILEQFSLAEEYPAHLHINLLSGYRRKGLGSQLVAALEQELRKQGCPGLFLGVSSHNPNAIRFYESCGFRKLGSYPGTILYGKKLESNGR